MDRVARAARSSTWAAVVLAMGIMDQHTAWRPLPSLSLAEAGRSNAERELPTGLSNALSNADMPVGHPYLSRRPSAPPERIAVIASRC